MDGVYDCDPRTNSDAQLFARLSYMDILNRGLGVMDSTAASLCKDNDIPIVVFNLLVEGNIKAALAGQPVGTYIGRD